MEIGKNVQLINTHFVLNYIDMYICIFIQTRPSICTVLLLQRF